jgi:exodeoxyribonuclease VII small subunit
MAEKKQKDNIGKLSFEEAIKELTNIVAKIEQGRIPLQDSLERYEKGMSLIQHCRGILQEAEARIEKISKTAKQDEDEAPTENQNPDELF